MVDAITVDVVVAVPVARAFDRFTRGLGDWWPREYTWSGEVLETIGMDPRAGGSCFEIGPHGFRCDWGRVLEWEPPSRVLLAWQVSPRREPVPDPRQASAVTVRFSADGPQRTRVVLVHDAFERHGEEGAAYRAAMASPQGWPFILQRYAEAAS
jgi:uncharacterized protein YndB with AHSA1/START domain